MSRTKVYFWSGFDKKSGKPDAIETVWDGSRMLRAKPIEQLPDGVRPIRMLKGELQRLRAGQGAYNQPWNHVRSRTSE